MWLVQFYRSTIGKKIIMAATGLIGIGFVIGHMAGNLQAFIGQNKLNAYGALLRVSVVVDGSRNRIRG